MNITQEKKQTKASDCQAFCPACGTDLYYQDGECICKNKECSWICHNCKNPA